MTDEPDPNTHPYVTSESVGDDVHHVVVHRSKHILQQMRIFTPEIDPLIAELRRLPQADINESEEPFTSKWGAYFSGHGVEVERRFVVTPEESWPVYRVSCEAADRTLTGQSLETLLARMIHDLATEHPAEQ